MNNDPNSPENSPWGWKPLIIACIIGAVFMGIFWLAVSNEPDYMPSQQKKDHTTQHAFKNAPAMSQEDLAEAQKQKEARAAMTTQSASEIHMSDSEHENMGNMTHDAASTAAHGH